MKARWPSPLGFVFAFLAASCMRKDHDTRRALAGRVCPTPAHGLIISLDTVASFPTSATLGDHMRRCAFGDTGMYDAVGWQSTGWSFPFAGARILAAQTTRTIDSTVLESQPADLWTAEGDSVRLPDGQLMPHTLGELRTRYAHLLVFEAGTGDDADGPQARACKFPYLLFHLMPDDSAGKPGGSAKILSVEMPIAADSEWVRLCARSNPIPGL